MLLGESYKHHHTHVLLEKSPPDNHLTNFERLLLLDVLDATLTDKNFSTGHSQLDLS